MDYQTSALIDSSETWAELVSIAHHIQELKKVTDTAGTMSAVLVKSRPMPVNAKAAQMVRYLILLEEHASEPKSPTSEVIFTVHQTKSWMLTVVALTAQVELLLTGQGGIAFTRVLLQFDSLLLLQTLKDLLPLKKKDQTLLPSSLHWELLLCY